MLSVSYIIQESIDKWKETENKLKLLFSDLYIMHFPIAFLGDENFTAQRDQNDPREVKAKFFLVSDLSVSTNKSETSLKTEKASLDRRCRLC